MSYLTRWKTDQSPPPTLTIWHFPEHNLTKGITISLVSLSLFLIFIYLVVLGLSCSKTDLITWWGSNPRPLQWKHGVLTTGPPGESPILGSYSVFPFVLGISIRDFLMRLLILCDLRQVALLSLHLFLRCHDGEDTTTSREISLSFHEIFNLSFPMSTPSFIQSLPCSKGWRWKATDSFEDLWETDKRGACAEAQGSERNRNLEIDKELRGTGGQVVLGSHWAEGHCIPWNFDSILWALRWQERALCRRQRWPEWLWKDRFPTLWRWARPEAGSQPLGDLPASEL